MTEHILIIAIAAVVGALAIACCYMVTSIDIIDARSKMVVDDAFTVSLTSQEAMRHSWRLVDSLERRRKPRYRVANAIVKLPRKRKSVVANGNEVKHGT